MDRGDARAGQSRPGSGRTSSTGRVPMRTRNVRRAHIGLVIGAMPLLALAPATTAAASPGKVTVYTVNASSIAAGADGNIWVSDGSSISKVSTSGVVRHTYPVSGTGELSPGPNGRIW